MKPHHVLCAIVALGAALGLAGARADDAKPAGKQPAQIAGRLVCVGCHLEKEYGAASQCTLHSKHAQGLLAEDGTLYTILDNARGHFFVTDKKLAGAPIRIEGFTFPKAQVLEAVRYQKKDGERWVQQDYCRICGFEPGDNKGGDLCDDCQK